jgi:hypothetical protein
MHRGSWASGCHGAGHHLLQLRQRVFPWSDRLLRDTSFSQAVVQAMASDRLSIDIPIEQGYPTNLDIRDISRRISARIFDRTTRWWKRNVVTRSTQYSTGVDTGLINTDTWVDLVSTAPRAALNSPTAALAPLPVHNPGKVMDSYRAWSG